ncbi:larval-specific very high density lipoprotein [Calliopsis andreniformis]|uniref:larval-specific very high density lipoprotein n=1 Tax=Calliopsis andreniformis TaxID=337506 RepID=UPI003FCD214B
MMNVLIVPITQFIYFSVLLGFLAAATNAVPAYFPRGKLLTYNYTVDAKAGLIDPAPHTSQFFINALVRVLHYTSDPSLKNTYVVRLTDIKYRLFNGPVVDKEAPNTIPQPLPPDATSIQSPFVIIFDENGRLQGIRVTLGETPWSQNIKRSIASMLQLDMVNVFSPNRMEDRSFVTHEDTIHGSCQVAYNVQQQQNTQENNFIITKIHEPRKCSNFSCHVFNHLEFEKCHIPEEDGMTVASRRVFEITNFGEEILIRKIVGHGVINYFPWLANAEAHYLLTNQTMILNRMEVVQGAQMFLDTPFDLNITFSKPTTFYSQTGDLDVTQGRHTVDMQWLVDTVMQMLHEAVGYLKEYHMSENKQPEWKQGQTLNRILNLLSFMNETALGRVHDRINHEFHEVKPINIFYGLVPNVGTTASCLFVLELVTRHAVPEKTAIMMLSVLPIHVKMPSKELLVSMEPLVHSNPADSLNLAKTKILCFSNLIHKTYVNRSTDEYVTKWLQFFMEHLIDDPSYEMKIMYLMAIRNVGLIETVDQLESIIRGDVKISHRPDSIRMQAILAVKKVIADLPNRAHDLLWPILSNVRLSIMLRIAAYEVLMNQLPNTQRLMNMYWFMVHETNEHLYNYHVETIKGLATSTDPCLMPVREMARKILRFTRIRQVTGPLSTTLHIDSFDETFGHGEGLKISLIMDQRTGLPFAGSVNYLTSVARRTASRFGMHWDIDGLQGIKNDFVKNVFGSSQEPIEDERINTFLAKVASNMHEFKNTEVCIFLTANDNVIVAMHYSKETWMKFVQELSLWKNVIENINEQYVLYDDHYEMHVPTDFGVPAVLATKTPSLDSFNVNITTIKDENGKDEKTQITCKYQEWKHGEYVMSIYNPIADVWHSIRRTGTRDTVLGINMTISYNAHSKSIQITFPRLPITEHSTIGSLTQAKNFVTITGDRRNVLPDSCPTCLHIQNVTGVISNKTQEFKFDSEDTALLLYSGIYNCEGHITPLPLADFHKIFVMNHNFMNYKEGMHLLMRIRHVIKNNMISSQRASCSNLNKIEPSKNNRASQVDFSLKVNKENDPTKPLHFLQKTRWDIHATMDVKSEMAPQVSMRHWDATANLLMNAGHTRNNLRMTITRTVPHEKNLKICIDAQKTYPEVNWDLLNMTCPLNETNTKITIVMGKTRDKCVRDEMDVTITVKGERTEEQSDYEGHGQVEHACNEHKHHTHLQTEGKHVPKTSECIKEAIMHTTLRKYTTNVVVKKVPLFVETWAHVLQDIMLSHFFPSVTYITNRTDSGNLRFVSEFSSWTPTVDTAVIQPVRSYKIQQLPFGDMIWNILMDNVHFSFSNLINYVNLDSKMCSVHPKGVMTYDHVWIPFDLPEKNFIMTADVFKRSFLVNVMRVTPNRLSVTVRVRNHTMEIAPFDESSVVVRVNGEVVDLPNGGVLVPDNEINFYGLRLTYNYDHWNIDSTLLPLSVHYTINSASVILSSEFRGQLGGVCGAMNGSHGTNLPSIDILPQQ